MINLDERRQDIPNPVEERGLSIMKAIRLFALWATVFYVGGTAVAFTINFADERDACYDADGMFGRFWCPNSVSTEGFTAHLTRAAGWPVNILRAPAEAPGTFENATEAMKRGDYAAALPTWEGLARRGNGLAGFNLALMYEDGRGVDQDYAQAVKWHQFSAARGIAPAQNSLGLLYKYGLGVEQDYGEAVKWFKSAAGQGNQGGLSNLGFMYLEGLGVAKNHGEAVRWFRLAAEQGEAEAQFNLSIAYAEGRGSRRDAVEAYKWANLAAAQGVERAIAHLDALAARLSPAQIREAERRIGEWEPPAAGEVSTQLRQVMDQVSVSAVQTALGELGYKIGKIDGVAGRSTRAAITKFQLHDGMPPSGEISDELVARLENAVVARRVQVAESQAANAAPSQRGTEIAYNCDILAAHYADTSRPAGIDGVTFSKIDAVRAIAACERAVARFPADPRFRFQLGRGLQRQKQYREAASYYQVSAEQGFLLAQKNLGFFYANGLGVPQDFTEAANWLHKAAKRGDVDAQFAMGRLYAAGRGVPQDRAEAVSWYKRAAAQNHLEARDRLRAIEKPN